MLSGSTFNCVVSKCLYFYDTTSDEFVRSQNAYSADINSCQSPLISIKLPRQQNP